jgi:hypothetical protein
LLEGGQGSWEQRAVLIALAALAIGVAVWLMLAR